MIPDSGDFESLRHAAEQCIALHLPFALYAFPGSPEFEFFCSLPNPESGECNLITMPRGDVAFEVALFDNQNHYPIGIYSRASAADIDSLDIDGLPLAPPDMPMPRRSTQEIVYRAQFFRMQQILREQAPDGKVVLSRLICGTTPSSPTEVAARYFSAFPDTFRFLYYTRETGLWLGASPELLMDIRTRSGSFTTMSLAGTRPRRGGRWDAKNSREQQIVTDYIVGTLLEHDCSDISVSLNRSLPFGDIEHRCAIIKGRAAMPGLAMLPMHLAPTPAVAGMPHSMAVDTIMEVETHSRWCYGGYLQVADSRNERLRSYVNLRSARLLPPDEAGGDTAYAVYVGGGLTLASDATSEWAETEAKAAPLLHALYP